MRNVPSQGNITLESGIEIVQPFYPASGKVTRIGFRFGTHGRSNECTIIVTIKDGDAVLFQQNMNPEEWVDGDVQQNGVPTNINGIQQEYQLITFAG